MPAWVNVPVPEIALATVKAFDRLTLRAALLMTAPEPSVPVVPPVPTCSVPPLMVVVPV